jgi:hypothetical protein
MRITLGEAKQQIYSAVVPNLNSQENVDRLTNQLGKSLNIKNTPESKRACRKFVETQMKSVFDKYSDKKPKKMPIPEFLYKLNQKSLDDCVKLYEVKTGKKNGMVIMHEMDLSIYYQELGFRGAITNKEAGYVRHIGGKRHVPLPWQR